MLNVKKVLIAFLVTVIAISSNAFAQNSKQTKKSKQPTLKSRSTPPNAGSAKTVAYLVSKVRHELVTLPYYNVFDWLEGEVKPDGTVILRGQVVRPTTKSDAGSRTRDIEGVTRLINQIEVLPLSPFDDRIRLAVYRTLYNFGSPLFRYGTQPVPPIHIIVRNGHVTLKGIVANEGDRNLAYIKTNTVPGTFEVRNELQVEAKS
ncbi:MAG: BON domain-containing protein [Pyrinomonadaceae bacterium]